MDRCYIFWGCFVLCLDPGRLALLTPSACAGEKTAFAVELGRRQLFFDDYGIEHRAGLKRVINQPRKHERNPVLQREHPWESFRTQLNGTVLYDRDQNCFHMWYQVLPRPSQDPLIRVGDALRVPHATLVAYATSKDGVTWRKPRLGQLAFEGDKNTNLLAVGRCNPEGPAVIVDPTDPDPMRRYKMLFWEHTIIPEEWAAYTSSHGKGNMPRWIYPEKGDGMWLAFSRDGIQWTDYGRVADYHSDSGQNLLWDPRIRKYVAFGRFGSRKRVTDRMESADGLHWSPSQLVLECDQKDGPGTQIYGIGATFYEGWYLAMVWIYREGSGHGINIQLAHSRDGIHWQRTADRQVFLPNGPPGSWDAGDIRTATQPVVFGDKIYIYYSGSYGGHHVPPEERDRRDFFMKFRSMHIGLATLRRDGWVSLDAGDQQGSLVTRPFELPDGTLHVNTDAQEGEVRVQLCDVDGAAIAESAAVTGDQLTAAVKFDGDLPKVGRRVRLKFLVENAKLYSFWWEDDGDAGGSGGGGARGG